jgi:hypothetical protein
MIPSRRLQLHLTRTIKTVLRYSICACKAACAQALLYWATALGFVAGLPGFPERQYAGGEGNGNLKTPHVPSPLCGRIRDWVPLEAGQLLRPRTPHDYFGDRHPLSAAIVGFSFFNTGRSPLLQLQVCQYMTVGLVSDNQLSA